MNSNWRSELISQTRNFWLFTQKVEQIHHSIEISIRLNNTPTIRTITPNVGNVLFSKRSEKMPIGHEIGAFSV